jgi:hypothetical protein
MRRVKADTKLLFDYSGLKWRVPLKFELTYASQFSQRPFKNREREEAIMRASWKITISPLRQLSEAFNGRLKINEE